MTKSRNLQIPHRLWTPTELELLRELYPDVPAADVAALLDRPVGQVHQTAARHGITKSAAFFASDLSSRIQRGKQNPKMMANRFHAGQVPWNAGLKGWCPPGVEHSQFKKGNRPHTWVPVGSYRITPADQILQRKVSDAPGASNKRWTPVARLVWEAAHGPIAKGALVVFKPGCKTVKAEEITVDKLECITRAQNARRNHPNSSNPELAKLCQLKGAITRQVNRITREHEQQTQGLSK